MNLTANGRNDEDNFDPACVEGRPTTMLIRNGNVYLQYANWQGDVLHYRGTVNPSGWLDLYHTNGDGNHSVLAGQISNDVLTGVADRGECHNSVSLAKK